MDSDPPYRGLDIVWADDDDDGGDRHSDREPGTGDQALWTWSVDADDVKVARTHLDPELFLLLAADVVTPSDAKLRALDEDRGAGRPVPLLEVDVYTPQRVRGWRVTAHEGRHRALWAQRKELRRMPTELHFTDAALAALRADARVSVSDRISAADLVTRAVARAPRPIASEDDPRTWLAHLTASDERGVPATFLLAATQEDRREAQRRRAVARLHADGSSDEDDVFAPPSAPAPAPRRYVSLDDVSTDEEEDGRPPHFLLWSRKEKQAWLKANGQGGTAGRKRKTKA